MDTPTRRQVPTRWFVVRTTAGQYIQGLMFRDTKIGKVCNGWGFTSKLDNAMKFDSFDKAALAIKDHLYAAVVSDHPADRVLDKVEAFNRQANFMDLEVVEVEQATAWQEVS